MIDTPDDMDILAAEYALRVLPAEELAQAEHLLVTDPQFAGLVAKWEAHLATLADELPEVAPRAAVKAAVLERLFVQQERTGFWSGVTAWRGLALASIVAMGAMLWVNTSRVDPVAGPIFASEIVSETQDFRVIAVVDTTSNEIILTKTIGAAPEGRILQVWAHGPDKPAISVGLWPDGDSVRLPMPSDIAAVNDILTIGVSEEPVGGSLTGSPSGRVFGTVDILVALP